MQEVKPFPFYKSFIYIRKLRKLAPGYKVYYTYDNITACSDLNKNVIYLPFIEPLDLSDLETLLKHEMKHFEITKEPAKIPVDLNLVKAQFVLNILEDIIINKKLPRHKLERIYKKLNNKELQITLWRHLNDKEKEEVINTLKKEKIFKDHISTEEIINTINETIKVRIQYDSVREFVDRAYAIFKKYYDLFSDEGEGHEFIGNGPCEYEDRYFHPNWELKKRFDKLIKNLKTFSEEINYEESYMGKRINRRFIETPEPLNLIRKPFKKVVYKRDIKQPRIHILIDCSGSMRGGPERRAKAFAISCLHHLDCDVRMHNQYFSYTTTNTDVVIKTPMTGDEWFDKLPDPENTYTDVFVIITDLNISNEESLGLYNYAKKINAYKKYLLCVDREYFREHEFLDEVLKRVDISNNNQFVEFVKRLVYTYI